jgi:hypothetical protein
MSKKRGLVFKKTKGHCGYCGDKLEPFGNWEIEHKLPKSRGGSNHINNLLATCIPCNRAKRNRTVEEFRQFIVDYSYYNLSDSPLHRLIYKLTPLTAYDLSERLEELAYGVDKYLRKEIKFYFEDPVKMNSESKRLVKILEHKSKNYNSGDDENTDWTNSSLEKII